MCLSRKGLYWGRGDDLLVRATTIGDWLIQEKDGIQLLRPNTDGTREYPLIKLHVGDQECGVALRSSTAGVHHTILPTPMNRKGRLVNANIPVFIVGDLNSLSPSDQKFYKETQLVNHIEKLVAMVEHPMLQELGKKLQRKFLTETISTVTEQEGSVVTKRKRRVEIDYQPMNILLSNDKNDKNKNKNKNNDNNEKQPPFVDLLASEDKKEIWHTVPTAVQEDYMHVQRMRLDAVLLRASSNVRVMRRGSIVSPCTEMLSDHLPVIVEIELETSKKRKKGHDQSHHGHDPYVSYKNVDQIGANIGESVADARGVCSRTPLCVGYNNMGWMKSSVSNVGKQKGMTLYVKRKHSVVLSPNLSVCTEGRICSWRVMVADHERELLQKREERRKSARTENQERWQREEKKFGTPVVAPKGKSCIETCALKQMACDVEGVETWNECDRLVSFFPCRNGCTLQRGALDAPAFDRENGGACIVGDVDETKVTCEGKHPRTERLCACGKAVRREIWSMAMESCGVTCARRGMVCEEDGFARVNECSVLSAMDPDVCGGTRCRVINVGERFVPVRETQVGMCFVDGSGEGGGGIEEGGGLCSEEYGATRERVCPCYALKRAMVDNEMSL